MDKTFVFENNNTSVQIETQCIVGLYVIDYSPIFNVGKTELSIEVNGHAFAVKEGVYDIKKFCIHFADSLNLRKFNTKIIQENDVVTLVVDTKETVDFTKAIPIMKALGLNKVIYNAGIYIGNIAPKFTLHVTVNQRSDVLLFSDTKMTEVFDTNKFIISCVDSNGMMLRNMEIPYVITVRVVPKIQELNE
jgi:hypothetical protein